VQRFFYEILSVLTIAIRHSRVMGQIIEDQSNWINLESVEACPVCGSQRLERKFDVRQITDDPLHSYAIKLDLSMAAIVACSECAFLFKNTRPSLSYLDQHYAESSDSYLKSIAEDDVEFREDFRLARRLLEEAFPRGGTILDVGCATGFFLESLGRNWNRHGVELFRLAVERSRSRPGIVVHEGKLDSVGFARESFDVVCSFDVLEHIPDPMPALCEVRRILKPEGWLLIGTGNSGSLAARLAGSRWTYLCIPEHLSFFNPRSLSRGLVKAGFSSIKFKRIHHGLKSTSVANGWLRGVGKHLAVTLCGENIVRMRIFRQKTTEFFVPYFFDHMICIAK
jgi:SAM-dependent methyltransferase